MFEKVTEIISKDFEEIYTSSLSLQLLDCYKKLYLNGKQPKSCKESQKIYFQRLLQDGIQKAKIMDEVRTFKLKKPTGLKYVGGIFHKHFNLETLTDTEAVKLLESGWMHESEFDKLPTKYIEEKEVEKQILAEEKAKTKEAKKKKEVE